MEAFKVTKNIILITCVFYLKKENYHTDGEIIHGIKDDLMNKTFHGHILTHQMHFSDLYKQTLLDGDKAREQRKLSFENIRKYCPWTFNQTLQQKSTGNDESAHSLIFRNSSFLLKMP